MKNIFVFISLLVWSQSEAKVAPAFSGELLAGGRTSLQEHLKPNRALLVCFWATWCVPCLEELKQVGNKLKANPELPLDLLTVNVDTSETSADVRPVLRQNGHKFPVILDPKHEILAQFNPAKTLPFSVLISSSGNLESSFSGFQEELFGTVENLVGKITKANVP